MAGIYIHSSTGQRGPMLEADVRSLWKQGIIPANASYWKEGMPDWRPITEFPGCEDAGLPIVAPGIPRPVQTHGRYALTKNLTGVTRFLQVMLVIYLGVAVLSTLSDWMEIRLLSSGEVSKEESDANDMRQGLVGFVYLGTYIVTAIFFLTWTYRAAVNAHGFVRGSLQFTPGWAVGGYFVPILNLYRPYQAMKEIWQASIHPEAWERQPVPALVSVWWLLWIVSCILGQISFRLAMRAETTADNLLSAKVSLASGILEVPLTLAAFAMISELHNLQKSLVES